MPSLERSRTVTWVLRDSSDAQHSLRPTVNTLCSLVPTSIDEFIVFTLLGSTKITQCRTPAQFLGNPQLSLFDLEIFLVKSRDEWA